jgi:hypothetical protein
MENFVEGSGTFVKASPAFSNPQFCHPELDSGSLCVLEKVGKFVPALWAAMPT